uniref:Receptor ligand binding region domain-containing protein n=1 Tax=Triticum urartu TaxID=4572 RepID=A0A8R7QXZ6_TRIUA
MHSCKQSSGLRHQQRLSYLLAWRNTTISPILSLSATMPTSSSSQGCFFLHTAANSNSQLATPIAAILEAFAWHSAILLHEDSPYGISILSALVHAFQGSRGLTDSVAVPADATDSRLDVALLAIKAMPARVYIVHMLPALAVRLFHRAMVLGMMSEGYVWISTTDIGEAAYNLGGIDNMQGVVSLRPHVQETDQVKSFSRRMNVRLSQDSTATDDPSAPMSLIWLYDTAWAAAAAAEVSFRSAERTTFLDALVAANFDGLAGRFRLVDGQRQVLAYEIVNAFSKGERTVGFWTPGSGITTSLDLKSARKELKQIVWPGETAAVPIGWSMSPNGRLLRVAVPVKRGFSQFVEISSNPSSATERVTGYCIDVFHAVMTKLKYPVVYSYVPVNDSSDSESYERLVELVPDKRRSWRATYQSSWSSCGCLLC